jgi:hypothetical protein
MRDEGQLSSPASAHLSPFPLSGLLMEGSEGRAGVSGKRVLGCRVSLNCIPSTQGKWVMFSKGNVITNLALLLSDRAHPSPSRSH